MNKFPVIAVNGWGSSEKVWDNIESELSESFELIKINWHECLVEENKLADTIDSMKQPFAVCGWSLGGLLVLEQILTSANKNLKGIILLSSTARLCSDTDYAGVPPRNIKTMMMQLKKSPEKLLAEFARSCIAPLKNEKFVEAYVNNALTLSTDTLRKGLEHLLKTDIRDSLDKINTPALVIHGDKDKIIPVENGRFLSENLPDAEYIELRKQRHSLVYECYKTVAQKIRSFINGLA